MRRAIELSFGQLGATSPNPPVGAVVLNDQDQVVGEGATQPAGGPHAEVLALRQAGSRASTLVVTLEPCNHTGRTGPCSEALIAAGVKKVVIGCAEPTAVAAGGAARLSAAGINVRAGVLEEEIAAGPLAAWLHRQATGRPFVTWKYAATLDGRSAATDGSSRWITGPEARADVHRLRGQSDAVIVGVGTVLADDPSLTARPDPGHQPLRVILDTHGRTPAAAKVLDGAAPTLVVTGGATYGEDRTLVQDGATDGIDLPWLLQQLADRDIVSVLLEGGPTLAGAFWRAGLIDQAIGYVAPTLLGSGKQALGDAGVSTIDEAILLQLTDISRLGDDLRLTMSRRG